MKITCFEDFAGEAKKKEKKTIIAVVEAHDEHTLESVIEATDDGIIIPALIGNKQKIKDLLIEFGADPETYDIVSSGGFEESLKIAVEMINMGKATAIMKGKLESGDFMKAVVNKENKLVTGGKLSLI